MPRPLRIDFPGIPQHVIQRGNDRQPCFFDDADYLCYRSELRDMARREGCAVHAYVLMTNHVHLLLTPLQPGAVARTMQSLGRRYVRYINATYGRTGTLWEGRYKASLVGDGDYLLRCHRYIELNPLRAGMVADPCDYRWSSHRALAFGEADPLMAFLDNGSGFCQQFATAFAAMARSIGLPSRVAVGFTYGDGAETVDPATGEATTTWTVRGRFAHAWPEVYVNGVGWVAFEPTPGRGNPDARSYSDVPPAQSDELGNSVEFGATTTTTTTIAPAQNGAVPTTAPDQLPPRPGDAAEGTSEEPTSNTPTVVILVIAALAALAVLLVRLRVVAVRRRRVRHRRADVSTADRVSSSWAQTCRDLARVDVRANPSETPVEFATRAAKLVEVEGLVVLGHRESDRRFRATPPDEQEAASAEQISDEVRDVVWSRLDRQQRLRADLDVG